LLIALTQEYFDYLKSLFQKHEIKKTYYAICAGEPKEKKGIIDIAIGIKSGTTKRTVFSNKMAKPAITEYEVEKVWKKPKKHIHCTRKPRTGAASNSGSYELYRMTVIGANCTAKDNAARRHDRFCTVLLWNLKIAWKEIRIEAPCL
jgi:hypothetical protein